jgi:hypothetical protein
VTARANRLGLTADGSFDDVVREYIAGQARPVTDRHPLTYSNGSRAAIMKGLQQRWTGGAASLIPNAKPRCSSDGVTSPSRSSASLGVASR